MCVCCALVKNLSMHLDHFSTPPLPKPPHTLTLRCQTVAQSFDQLLFAYVSSDAHTQSLQAPILHRGLIIGLPPPPVIQDHQTVNNVLNVRFPHLGY